MSLNQAQVPRKYRILVVDDHPLVRDGLAWRLEKEADLELCGEAECVERAVLQISTKRPDVVVLDLSLGQEDGIELLQHIQTIEGPIRTVVLSTYEEGLYAERALRAGAMGYVHKSASWDVVIEAIRTVLQGKRYLSEAVSDRLLKRLLDAHPARNTDGDLAKPPSLVDALTDRELSIFRLIGQGLTTKQIANRLLLSTHTVDSHRENIKRKLRVKYASELQRLAIVWTLENT